MGVKWHPVFRTRLPVDVHQHWANTSLCGIHISMLVDIYCGTQNDVAPGTTGTIWMSATTKTPTASIVDGPFSANAAERLAARLKAVGDPARLQLLSMISENEEMCVCDMTEPLGLSQPTVSHHLKVLTKAGFLHREQRGKWAYFRVDDDELSRLAQSLVPSQS